MRIAVDAAAGADELVIEVSTASGDCDATNDTWAVTGPICG